MSPISDVTLNEGGTATVDVAAADIDGDAITLTSTLPGFASLNPPTSGTGAVVTTITLNPLAGDAGTHTASVTATAGGESATEEFTIHVPGDLGTVAITPIDDVTVAEGASETVDVLVIDPDSGTMNLIASGLPAFATLNAPTSSTGEDTLATTISIDPGAGTAGTYPVTLTATAGTETDTEEFTITVTGPSQNTPPVVDAPETRTVDEGQTLTFTVTATDADSDTVGLSILNLPNGATFTDNGDNTGTFTWTPGDEQSGSYTIPFTGDDGNGGTDSDTTRITVNDVPDVDFETNASLIGRYNRHKKFLCFRILQEDAEFDLRDVTMTSVTLSFEGRTLDPMAGKTHIGYDCDDCFECDDDGEHDDDDGDDDDGEDDDGEDDDEDCDREDCEAAHLRTCFSMSDLRDFFGDEDVLDGLKDSEIHGTLSTGETFVATLGGKHMAEPPGHDRDDDGDEDRGGKHAIKLRVRPNPLNPKAEITFSLAQAGPVRIALYDLSGRLVRTVLEAERGAGDHVVSFDTNAGGTRVASGVYFLKIEARQGEDVRRVTVLK
ncbi:MAG TPA: putative Ig domain-containing protein [Candidatus Eisenbacteria bacterium]|nr:putative Ig domain-containing protein [Candidatus Eisenbacteria bacterium]